MSDLREQILVVLRRAKSPWTAWEVRDEIAARVVIYPDLLTVERVQRALRRMTLEGKLVVHKHCGPRNAHVYKIS